MQVTKDKGLTWESIPTGNSATILKLFIDSKGWIWLSYATDTLAAGEELLAGKGISVYRGAKGWLQLAQPIDDRVNFDTLRIQQPVTTEINNLTYDITETLDTLGIIPRRIWLASFAGSLRYIEADSLENENWVPYWTVKTPSNVKLDVAREDAFGLSQRTFSLAADYNRLWVGTAFGIFYSTDMGDSLISISSDPTAKVVSNLSANFITTLKYSEEHLFAMALIVNAGEEQALNIVKFDPSQTRNSITFKREHIGSRTYDAVRKDGINYLAHDNGFYISNAANTSWTLINNIKSNLRDIEVSSQTIYNLLITDEDNDKLAWWLAANDGLAYSNSNGNTWLVYKARQINSGLQKQGGLVVYPSPFRPIHNQIKLSISFNQEKSGQTKISIYDYSMHEVYSESVNRTAAFNQTIYWDGKTNSGDYLANGVYFVKVKTPNDTLWSKVVVLN